MEIDLGLAAVAAAVALVVIAVVWLLLARRPRLPYRRVEYVLTPAERSFWVALRHAVGEAYYIAWKVRMADVLYVPYGVRDRQRHLNRVLAKHLDFVLCDPDTSSPVLAIELDDSSHAAPERRERDALVDAALDAARLPLLRVPARRAYDSRELRELISRLSLAAGG